MNKGKIVSWLFTICIIAFYIYYFYYIYSSYTTAISNAASGGGVSYVPMNMQSGSFYDNTLRYTHLRDSARQPSAEFPSSNSEVVNFVRSRTVADRRTEEGDETDISFTLAEGSATPTRHYGRCDIQKRELTNRNNKILIDLGDITKDFQVKISDFWLDVCYTREEFSRNLPLFLDVAVVQDQTDKVKLIPGTIITQKLTRELSLEIGEESAEMNMYFKIRPKQQQLGKFNSPDKLKNDLSLMISLKSDAIFKATISDLKIDFFG